MLHMASANFMEESHHMAGIDDLGQCASVGLFYACNH